MRRAMGKKNPPESSELFLLSFLVFPPQGKDGRPLSRHTGVSTRTDAATKKFCRAPHTKFFGPKFAAHRASAKSIPCLAGNARRMADIIIVPVAETQFLCNASRSSCSAYFACALSLLVYRVVSARLCASSVPRRRNATHSCSYGLPHTLARTISVLPLLSHHARCSLSLPALTPRRTGRKPCRWPAGSPGCRRTRWWRRASRPCSRR